MKQFNRKTASVGEPPAYIKDQYRYLVLVTQPHEKMGRLLESENCPSPVPVEHCRANLEKLQSESSQEVIDRLLAASRTYEKKWGLDLVS